MYIISSMALFIDLSLKYQYDGIFNWLLLVAIGIWVASLVLFIQMMQRQKELERFGYRKNSPTPVVWYIVYFACLLSFVFSFVSLLMVAIQKKRIERILRQFIQSTKY